MQQSFFSGIGKTPLTIKVLLWITVLTSILSPIISFFTMETFKVIGPGGWLPLSLMGIAKGWFWQPVTYFFVHSFGHSFSLYFLISIFFYMFLLWFSGRELCSRFGSLSFLLFYFGAGILAGLAALLYFFFFAPNSVLIGAGPPIYACLMAWAMICPDLDLYLFLVWRIRAKWLVVILLAIGLLFNFLGLNFATFFANLIAIGWGFLFGKWIWKLPNPYKKEKHYDSDEKIIDITRFAKRKEESDTAFINRMLDKISRFGEDSLSEREKRRMEKIGKRRQK
ncbi:MAG: rhomboid family intramembrane serine protease [Chlamydiales bacterium]